jgi:hypothetical protein
LTAIVGATPTDSGSVSLPESTHSVVHNFPIAEEIGSSAPQAWKDRPSTVAYVGSISRECGVFEMLEALNKLDGVGDCRLALARWFSPVTLKLEIEKSPWAGRVDFRGRLFRD